MRMGNGGLVVCLPKAWWEYYCLKAGDRVLVITNGELRILPGRKKRAQSATKTKKG